jgi:hypothetical protein
MRLKPEFNLPDIMQLDSFIDLRFVGRHDQGGEKRGRYYPGTAERFVPVGRSLVSRIPYAAGGSVDTYPIEPSPTLQDPLISGS